MTRLMYSCALSALCLAMLGCGSQSGADTAAVSGTVTMDGEPLEGAEINFYNSQSDFLATGLTGPDGKYQLYQGAAIGDNKVWIEKRPATEEFDESMIEQNPELDPGQMEAMASAEGTETGEEAVLPEKFSDPEKSVLQYKVPDSGADNANFDLTSE